MNSYIVRLKKIDLSSTEHDLIYFLIQIGCRMVASDILHLTIKNREAAVSSLLNRILLKTLCVMKCNSTKIILWTFLSTSEEMLLNCYNQACIAFGSGYQLWTGFQNSLFTLIYLPIKSSLYNIEQNSNMKVTRWYDFTGIT